MSKISDAIEKEKIYIRTFHHKNSSLHSHKFLELAYVANGTAYQIRDNVKTKIHPGNYYIVDFNSYHEYITDDEDFSLINCLFVPQFIDSSLYGCTNFKNLLNNYMIRLSADFAEANPTQLIFNDSDGRIKEILLMLLSEYDGKQPGYLEIMRSGLIEIIIRTVRKTTRRDTEVLYKDFNKYIIKRIMNDYMEELTLSKIAAELNYTVPYLSKSFKEGIGIGFSEYLRKIRIEEACRLLANTDMKITDIAVSVGYNDISCFNGIFKRTLGMTPREFKKTIN